MCVADGLEFFPLRIPVWKWNVCYVLFLSLKLGRKQLYRNLGRCVHEAFISTVVHKQTEVDNVEQETGF